MAITITLALQKVGFGNKDATFIIVFQREEPYPSSRERNREKPTILSCQDSWRKKLGRKLLDR